ncbi:MAG TPA: hypothetical protein VFW87_19045 [Pirellulales bacterium]|nr:hypothetical protein [Pirellulales bacterium]
MTMLRKAVTLVTIIALAGNSAAASLRPCCCTERQQPETPQPETPPPHTCCEPAPTKPQLERASCCSSKAVAGARLPSPPAIGEKPCCCIKSLPATPAARGAVFSRSASPVDPALVGDSLRLADFPPAKQRLRRGEPGLLFATAPHVCALYCIWLN